MEPRAFDDALLSDLPVGAKITDAACPGLTARRLKGGTILEWRGRLNGRKITYRLGYWPKQVSLERARTMVARYRAGARGGYDPRTHRLPKPLTVDQALDRYAQDHLAFKRTGRRVEADLRRHLKPLLTWPVGAIGRADLKTVLDPYIATHRWSSAHTIRLLLQAFMNWCELEELIERAPGRIRLPVAPRKRSHVPTIDQLRVLFAEARTLRARHRAFVRVLMLGGFRRGEAASLRPEEWQGDRIVLGAERTKQAREHIIPVTRAMAAELPALVGAKPVGGFTWAKNSLVKASGIEGWRFHDFRRALRSHLRDEGVDRDVLERILGHSVPGAEGHYDYAKLLRPMCEALDLWEGLIVRA